MSNFDQTQALVYGTATGTTHDDGAQPKEDGCEGHHQVDLPAPGHPLPLYIARDDKEREEQAYHRT